jgi:RimJ/RimL family protein N-acetyltransferase
VSINARLSVLRPTGCAPLQPRGPHPAPVTGVATTHRGARGQPAEGDLDMPGYPGQYESDAVLSDGSRIHLRPIRPDDATRLLDLYHRLSPRSLYHRFFTIPRPDPVYAKYLADVDYINHFALVAVCDAQIIAVARYFRRRDFPNRAEAAITVADAWQAKGIGPLMLDRLAIVAREQQITSFEGRVLTDNQQILKALSRSPFHINQTAESGVINLTVSLAPHAKAKNQPEENVKAHRRSS